MEYKEYMQEKYPDPFKSTEITFGKHIHNRRIPKNNIRECTVGRVRQWGGSGRRWGKGICD